MARPSSSRTVGWLAISTGKVQVSDQAPDNRQLLGVLLTKHHDVRAHQIQQLGNDRGYTAEMTRSELAFESHRRVYPPPRRCCDLPGRWSRFRARKSKWQPPVPESARNPALRPWDSDRSLLRARTESDSRRWTRPLDRPAPRRRGAPVPGALHASAPIVGTKPTVRFSSLPGLHPMPAQFI